jgi:hypothetical protein
MYCVLRYNCFGVWIGLDTLYTLYTLYTLDIPWYGLDTLGYGEIWNDTNWIGGYGLFKMGLYFFL